MKKIKLWPHVTVAVLAALAVITGIVLYQKHEQTAEAAALPNAARIQRVDGEVALNNSLNSDDENWTAAVPNQPFSVGDRIYTRNNARTSLAFSGRNFARLEPNTSFDVVTLRDDLTQVALRDGSAIFDVGYLAPSQLFEVATPNGAVDFIEPGLYDVGLDGKGAATISVLNGLAQVVGLGGSGRINKGELLTLAAQTAGQVVLSKLNRQNAGYFVDDYYRYQYPNVYDGRYLHYDTYLNDPYYWDPYRRNVSYKYASSSIPGIDELDYYGDWQYLNGSGYVWCPRVDTSWSPYQDGQWFNDYPYGLTWVSNEPWGYAPYHYGRWIYSGNRWFWIPDGVNTSPRYSPALVAFVPLQNDVGWVPLGPSDPYVPRYYDSNWQPHYFSREDLTPSQLANINVPGAVTVVSLDQLDRNINGRVIRVLDPGAVTRVQPTLEPLTFTPLRNAVLHSAWGRGKTHLPPGIAKKLDETPVVISRAEEAPPFRRDLARSLRLETVPDKAKGEKLKLKDDRNAEQAQGGDEQRRQRLAELSAEAARGNREARHEARQLEQQLKRDQVETRRQAELQQRAAEEQQRQAAQQQRRQQMDAERAARQQQRAGQEQQRQAAQQQRRQQMDAERAARQQQRAGQEQQRQAAQQQRRQQMDAERAARQQQRAGQEQQKQAAQERKQPPTQPQPQGEGKGKGKGKGKP